MDGAKRRDKLWAPTHKRTKDETKRTLQQSQWIYKFPCPLYYSPMPPRKHGDTYARHRALIYSGPAFGTLAALCP